MFRDQVSFLALPPAEPKPDRLSVRFGWKEDIEADGRSCQDQGMPRLLSIVEDTFQISGRGVIVMPGIPRQRDWRIKVGDPLFLHRPDGSALQSSVFGIEMASPPHPSCIPLLIGPGLTKDDIPVGTELWVDS